MLPSWRSMRGVPVTVTAWSNVAVTSMYVAGGVVVVHPRIGGDRNSGDHGRGPRDVVRDASRFRRDSIPVAGGVPYSAHGSETA